MILHFILYEAGVRRFFFHPSSDSSTYYRFAHRILVIGVEAASLIADVWTSLGVE